MNSEDNRSLLGNSKGFTLVELVVTIAIMSIIVVIVGGSLSTAYKARSKSVSGRISSLISQCKINSLSGIESTLEVSYDSAQKKYICTLTKTGETAPYKTEEIGNSRVSVTVGNGNSKISESSLKITFSKSTGAVQSITQGSVDLTGNAFNTISVSSSKTYVIKLYTRTGEQEVLLI